MNFDFYDSDNNRYFVWKHCNGAPLESRIHWCDEYRIIDEDGNVELVEKDRPLTRREILKLEGGRNFLEG